jgi:hypothetical protein
MADGGIIGAHVGLVPDYVGDAFDRRRHFQLW